MSTSLLPGECETNPSATLIEQSAIVASLLPSLHAASTADLVMWSECELVQWIDAAVKKLARKVALFIGRSLDTVTAECTRAYAVPAQYVSMIHVSYDGQPLRPTSTGELVARDTRWMTRTGRRPASWYVDTIGLAQVGIYPVPGEARSIWMIYHGWPQTVDCAEAHTSIPLPKALEPYIELNVIAEAYTKEGDGYAPDIATAARGLSKIYERVALEYWGPAQ